MIRCRPLQRQYNNIWQRYVHIKLIHGPHGFPAGRAWHGLHARSYASHQEPVDLFSTSSQKITVLNVAGMAAELVADQLMEAGAMSAGYIPDPPAGSVRHLIHDEVLHMSPSRNDRALAMEPIHSNFERMHRVEEFRDADEKEQKIYGDTRAVWNRCCVHGLFRAQIDMQSLQEQLQSVTGEASLQYEAGGHPQPLLSPHRSSCSSFSNVRPSLLSQCMASSATSGFMHESFAMCREQASESHVGCNQG